MRRRLLLLSADLGLVAAATAASFVLRDNLEIEPSRFVNAAPYIWATGLSAFLVLPLMSLNRSMWRFSGPADFSTLAQAALLIVAGASAIAFSVDRMAGVPRSLPFLHIVTLFFALLSGRLLVRAYHRHRSRPKQFAETVEGNGPTVLIVGLGPLAELYLASIDELAPGQTRVAGLLAQKSRHKGRLVRRHKVLGTPREIDTVVADLAVHGVPVDKVVVAISLSALSSADRQALSAFEAETQIPVLFLEERMGLKRASPDLEFAEAVTTPEDRDLVRANLDLSSFTHRPYWTAKRGFDIIMSALAIVLTSPIMLVVALSVLWDAGRPILFVQQRRGLGGYPFAILKFRTMGDAFDDAGTRLPDAQRVSGVGRFLRRSRLDELPQLFNVLLGHMSIIGPRPLVMSDMEPRHAARLLVRPGLTGWAQVMGGREVSMNDKAALDLWYIRNASFLVDTKIALSTVRILVLGERIEGDAVAEAWRSLRDLAATESGAARSRLAA